MSQFDFSAAEYADKLDPLLAGFGSESLEFAQRKAEMILAEARRFGPTKHLDVLDVGCGPGTIDTFLLGSFRRLVCVDTSSEMLAAAKERLPAVGHFPPAPAERDPPRTIRGLNRPEHAAGRWRESVPP